MWFFFFFFSSAITFTDPWHQSEKVCTLIVIFISRKYVNLFSFYNLPISFTSVLLFCVVLQIVHLVLCTQCHQWKREKLAEVTTHLPSKHLQISLLEPLALTRSPTSKPFTLRKQSQPLRYWVPGKMMVKSS